MTWAGRYILLLRSSKNAFKMQSKSTFLEFLRCSSLQICPPPPPKHFSGAKLFRANDVGRDPFDQNFRKFRFKIKWNRTFLEIHFENCGQPPEVVPFSGNLKIPEISCSIFGISTRFESTPVPLVVKSYKMAASKSVESTLHWMQNDLPRLEPVNENIRI